MRRASRLAVLGLLACLLTALCAGFVAAGPASAVDTPTEPPPCGNTGQPCEVGTPAPAPAPAPGPTCGEGGPACTEPPPGETAKSPNPVPEQGTPTPKQPDGGSTSGGSTSDSGSGSGSTGNGQGGSGTGGDRSNGGGNAPTVAIGEAKLIVGTPVAVSIAFIGGDGPEGDAGQLITVTVTVGSGSVSINGGPTGPSATITAPFSSIRDGVPSVLVTAARAGEVTIDVSAAPTNSPSEGIAGNRTLAAPEPAPTPEPVATEASAAQVVAPTSEAVTASATQAVPTQQRSITLPTYVALDQPQQVVDTTVAVVAVLGVIGLSAGALAGGIQMPASPSTPSPSSPSSSSSDPASRRAEDAGRHQAGQMRERRSEGSLSSVDVSFSGLAAGLGAAGVADRWRLWRPPLTAQIDRSLHVWMSSASRISPLSARLLADSTYLRAMFGSASLLLPIAAIVLAVIGVVGVNGLALAPSVVILGLITFIGTLDAMAGFAAFVTFGVGVGVMGGITGADSIRTLLGLGVIGFGPALIAGAARPLRRGRDNYDLWERLTDFVIIPLIGAFAVQSMVGSLSGLSGYELPIVSSANLIALIALGGLLLRVSLEEFAARTFPGRIAQVAPAAIPAPGVLHRSIVAVVRTIMFVFVAIAFIGTAWQLWAGAAIFAAAQACDIIARYTPNSPRLFHVTPVGIPKLVVILLVSLGITTAISLVVAQGPDLARTSFVLLMLPGLALAALGMFAKEPREGDTRWYLRPSMRVWYRIGGAVLLVTAIYMTQFA